MEFIQPTTVAASTGPGSHVVKANGWVYISGQVALNENGEVVGRGDIHAQVEQTLKNLKALR